MAAASDNCSIQLSCSRSPVTHGADVRTTEHWRRAKASRQVAMAGSR